MGTEIDNKLSDAGYHLLGDNERIEELILDILESKNNRYLKALLFLIYKYELDVHNIYKKTKEKELFNTIIGIASKIFNELNIDKRLPNYAGLNKGLESEYLNKFKLDYDDFKYEFELQLKNEIAPNLFIDKQKFNEERELQYSLSALFTDKEKQIIKRLLNNKPVSKTDYEYFSRKTKKKLKSIISLEDFAKSLYNNTPHYDEDLFRLKKMLEKELLNEKSQISKYNLSDNEIIIDLVGTNNEVEIHSFKLSQIKNNDMLNLLKKYPEHDFR
ncbi:MAG: hypothetical protein V1859_10150 [archaeon]